MMEAIKLAPIYTIHIGHFDLKQMLCHLSAIVNKVLENKDYKKVNFIYLVYQPTEKLLNFIEKESDKNKIISL